jgi:glycosyltransferase involved in cell wall biosynthesis
MHVLIISEMSPPYATGGGEKRYSILARELVAMGHRVSWLSMRQKDSTDAEAFEGVWHVHAGPRIMQPPLRSFVAKLRFMLSVFVHLARHRPDVVDCQTYAPLPAAWVICKLKGIPLVATIHDTSAVDSSHSVADQWMSRWDGWLANGIERRLYQLSYTRVLTVSEAVKDALVQRMGVAQSSISVVPNGIDVRAIDAIAPHPTPTDLIFVGRMVPHKHPEVFLEVAALVSAERKSRGLRPLRLRMIGGGPLSASIRAQAETFGVSDELEWLGELESHADVIAHIKAARVLVLPSTREGFGLVLAEAMACGTAFAAYAVEPVVETAGPELADCLAAPADLPHLARVVSLLTDDEDARERRIAFGHARVREKFGAENFARAVSGVYQLAGRAGCAREGPRA